MKLLTWRKDGGPESRVHGFFIVEIKSLFSIVLLRFSHGSRNAYHSHAFNSVNWLLKGELREYPIDWAQGCNHFQPSWRPIYTPRTMFHKVVSIRTSWVLSFRGPWAKTWQEYVPGKAVYELTHGRRHAE